VVGEGAVSVCCRSALDVEEERGLAVRFTEVLQKPKGRCALLIWITFLIQETVVTGRLVGVRVKDFEAHRPVGEIALFYSTLKQRDKSAMPRISSNTKVRFHYVQFLPFKSLDKIAAQVEEEPCYPSARIVSPTNVQQIFQLFLREKIRCGADVHELVHANSISIGRIQNQGG
jgi:hypothetical protein